MLRLFFLSLVVVACSSTPKNREPASGAASWTAGTHTLIVNFVMETIYFGIKGEPVWEGGLAGRQSAVKSQDGVQCTETQDIQSTIGKVLPNQYSCNLGPAWVSNQNISFSGPAAVILHNALVAMMRVPGKRIVHQDVEVPISGLGKGMIRADTRDCTPEARKITGGCLLRIRVEADLPNYKSRMVVSCSKTPISFWGPGEYEDAAKLGLLKTFDDPITCDFALGE